MGTEYRLWLSSVVSPALSKDAIFFPMQRQTSEVIHALDFPHALSLALDNRLGESSG